MAQIRADTIDAHIGSITRDIDVVDRLRPKQGNILLAIEARPSTKNRSLTSSAVPMAFKLMPDSGKVAVLGVDETIRRIVYVGIERRPTPFTGIPGLI